MDMAKLNGFGAGANQATNQPSAANIAKDVPASDVPVSNRDQDARNAIATFQARYGEKPKEARALKKSLDKDDFMRIMITEMKHQDPTKPMDSDRMATQMAQVTSVEQLKNVSNAIEKLSDKNSASDRLAMSAMIGKTVTVDKGRFTHQKGTLSPVNYDLPEDAQKIKVTIMNEKGEPIATRELEPAKAGTNVFNWDGVNESNIQSPSGAYAVRIDAENAKGNKIKIDPISKEVITGVTLEGGETNFLVGDVKSPQKVAFKNVIRIEGDQNNRADAEQLKAARMQALLQAQRQTQNAEQGEEGAPAQMGKSLSAAGAENAAPKVAPNGLPTGLAEKLKAEQMARGSQTAEAGGFPNGLKE